MERAHRELPDGERRVQRSIVNTSRSFAPNVIPDGYITGSINKLQRIGTRYSAGVLAESTIFTIYIEYMSNNV